MKFFRRKSKAPDHIKFDPWEHSLDERHRIIVGPTQFNPDPKMSAYKNTADREPKVVRHKYRHMLCCYLVTTFSMQQPVKAVHHMKRAPVQFVARQSESEKPLVIQNLCKDVIYPGILTQAGDGPPVGGFKLNSGEERKFTVSADWQGRVWGRTNCSFNAQGTGPSNRDWSVNRGRACLTGDCGGIINCKGTVSLAFLPRQKHKLSVNRVKYRSPSPNSPSPPPVVKPSTTSLLSMATTFPWRSFPCTLNQATLLSKKSRPTSPIRSASAHPPCWATRAIPRTPSRAPTPLFLSLSNKRSANQMSKAGALGIYRFRYPPSPPTASTGIPTLICNGPYSMGASLLARSTAGLRIAAQVTTTILISAKAASIARGRRWFVRTLTALVWSLPQIITAPIFAHVVTAFDDQTSTFIIPSGGGFQVDFCPTGRSSNILAVYKQELSELSQTGHVRSSDLLADTLPIVRSGGSRLLDVERVAKTVVLVAVVVALIVMAG